MSVDSSPGPRYHVDAKMTRFGRDGTPSYSMLGRKKTTGGFSSDLMLEFHLFYYTDLMCMKSTCNGIRNTFYFCNVSYSWVKQDSR